MLPSIFLYMYMPAFLQFHQFLWNNYAMRLPTFIDILSELNYIKASDFFTISICFKMKRN